MFRIFPGFVAILADIAPPDTVRHANRGDGIVALYAAGLAIGAALVTSVTLLVWRRVGRRASPDESGTSAERQATAGTASLAVGAACVLIAALIAAGIFLLGPTDLMGILVGLSIFFLGPLLGATGAALGGIALAARSPVPRLRRWQALAGLAINALTLALPVLFLFLYLVWRNRGIG